MSMTMRLLATATILAVAGGSAFGLSIVQTKTFTGDVGNVNQVFVYDQFDTQGGTRVLDSVQILVGLQSFGGERTVDNDDSVGATGTVEIGLTGGISSADVSLVDLAFQPIGGSIDASTSGSLTVDPDDGDLEVGGTPNVSVVGPDAATYTGGNPNDGDVGFVAPAVWTALVGYIGTGTYTINADYTAYSKFLGFGGIQDAGEPPTSDGFVTVIYEYHNEEIFIPEPMTLGAVSAAFAGLAGYLRRRNETL